MSIIETAAKRIEKKKLFEVQNNSLDYAIQKDKDLGRTVEQLQSEIKVEAINWHYCQKDLSLIKARVASVCGRYGKLGSGALHTLVTRHIEALILAAQGEHSVVEDNIKKRMDAMVKKVLEEGEAEDAAR